MQTCSVCGGANLNEFEVESNGAPFPLRWCEGCGSLHLGDAGTDARTWQPEYSMLNRQVLAFHRRFGQSVGEKPHVPDEKTVRFRLSLITEEFFELLEAAFNPKHSKLDEAKAILQVMIERGNIEDFDLSAFIDATLDIDYVVEGTRITMGVNGTPIAAEVQRANMAKLPSYVAAKDAHHGKREPVEQKCVRCGNHRNVRFLEDDSTIIEENLMAASTCRKGHEYPPLGEPVKREDGKIMKPPGWTPPDIEGELKKQGWEP